MLYSLGPDVIRSVVVYRSIGIEQGLHIFNPGEKCKRLVQNYLEHILNIPIKGIARSSITVILKEKDRDPPQKRCN